jgi:small subunit ribosomal protein S9
MAVQKIAEYTATGRRKTSVARVRLALGVGKMMVNGKDLKEYFPTESVQGFLQQPFHITDTVKRYDVLINVQGGGQVGQAGAIRHGISRALIQADPDLKATLKDAGCLTRDPREKERKKPGRPGARKRFQFSKR